MSESDAIFNEGDRTCAALQVMLSTEPSYDNRNVASTLKMQTRIVQHLRAQLNASDDPLEVVERKPLAEDTARKTSSKDSPKRFRQSLMKLSRFSRLTLNCECMCEGGLEVLVLQAPDKPDLNWEDKEPQANQVHQVAQQTEASQETKHSLVLFRRKELLPGPGAQYQEPLLDCHE